MSLVNFNTNIQYDFQLPKINISTTNFKFTPIKNYSTYTSGNNLFSLYNNNFEKKKKVLDSNNNNTTTNSLRSNKVSTTLEDAGYDKTKGDKLANTAAKNTVGFTHQCATYVKNAIQNSGLGAYEYGDAYECANILKRNKNFKEISTKGLDLSTLPAGCVLVYDKGVAGYSSKYGHTEITLGNGQAASDGVTNNIRQGARVFVPVSQSYVA